MNVYKDIVSQFIFGSLDGAVSVLGVVIGLASSGNSKIIAAAVGLAAAAAVSMGFGEFLGDTDSGIPEAIAMGISTLFGTLIPILPFIFFAKVPAFIIAGFLTLSLGTVIGYFRHKGRRGYLQTYLMLIVAIAITILVTLLIPGVGG